MGRILAHAQTATISNLSELHKKTNATGNDSIYYNKKIV